MAHAVCHLCKSQFNRLYFYLPTTSVNKLFTNFNDYFNWGSGVAQLAERLLPSSEVRGSNPVIDKFSLIYLLTKIKLKRPGMVHILLKKNILICWFVIAAKTSDHKRLNLNVCS